MNETDEDRLITYKECAQRMSISEKTLRRMVDKLKIPRVVMGHQIVRFHYPTVLKYFHNQKHNS